METAIESAVGFLLENLVQLIEENYELISGVSSIVIQLSENLKLLKSFFVTSYNEKHYENEILEDLAKQIKALIREAEDAIEEYVYYVSRHQSRGAVHRALNLVDYKLKVRAVRKKIEDVNQRINEILYQNHKIGEGARRLDHAVRGGSVAKKPKAGVPWADKVIGFQDAAIEVIERLTRKEFEELEVVSIVGMLGLGKTTLARKVLIDPVIEYEFFTRIFVAVTQDYDKREVLQTILVQGNFFENVSELHGKSIDELEKLINEKLRNKYLVVLDDVWTNDVWDDLKTVFPDNKKGSRVLITTRHNFVAEYSKSKIKPYDLRFLYLEESWELLRTLVFDENVCPQHLDKIETSILDKCKRLPLAIVATAGILRNNREGKEWWEKVFRGMSATDLVADEQKQSDMLIKMSYDHLPYKLKPCFLYLGVFPEDVEIPVWKLIRLWIAEGFIQQSSETSLEEMAERYLRELVDRNLVMVGERRSNDEIKTCRVHDTLHNFCKKMAIEENLFQEIKSSNEATSSSPSSSVKSSRRLCVNTYISEWIYGKPLVPYVHSFLSFSNNECTLQRNSCSLIFKPFKLLSVLDIMSVKLRGRCPAELPNLVLLIYIAISCEFKMLPRKMSRLFNLQTIIIHTTSSTIDVQLDLWKMTHLRHFHTNASSTLPKCPEQSLMVNLQTLSIVSPESCVPEVFDRAQKLKKLGIRGKLGPFVQANGESSLFDSFLKLEFLENLKLHNDDVTCKLPALPFAHKFPAKLKRLCLQGTSLDWPQMSKIGKLKFLEVLKLKDNAFKGQHWVTEDGGFLCLKVLFIIASDLKVWNAKTSNFPEIKCLVLKHCSNLEAIPTDFVNIKSLQVIDLEYPSKSVVTAAKNMQSIRLRVLKQNQDIDTNELKVKIYPPE